MSNVINLSMFRTVFIVRRTTEVWHFENLTLLPHICIKLRIKERSFGSPEDYKNDYAAASLAHPNQKEALEYLINTSSD